MRQPEIHVARVTARVLWTFFRSEYVGIFGVNSFNAPRLWKSTLGKIKVHFSESKSPAQDIHLVSSFLELTPLTCLMPQVPVRLMTETRDLLR